MRAFMMFLFLLLQTKGHCGKLDGKIAVITGASKGIGKDIAKLFAKEGATVVLTSRTENDLKNVSHDIQKSGGKASYIVSDVSKLQDVENLVSQTLKDYGRIDILIHNAGIYPINLVEDMHEDEWDKVIATNLTSAFYLVKACLSTMKKQKYGRIIFTSSISGPRVGLPGASHYTASKAGMNGFMRTIAIELAKDGITVNAVEPGNIISEGFEELSEGHKRKMLSAIPMNRLGTGEDVGQAHLFLASDAASYITGQSIIVDGGQTLPESDALIPR